MPVGSRVPRRGGRRPRVATRLPEALMAPNEARPEGRNRASAQAAARAVAPKTPQEESPARLAGSDDAPGKTAERAPALRCAESRLAASGDPWRLTSPPTPTGRQPTPPRPGPCPAPVSPDVTKSLGLRHRAVSRSHPSNSVPP